MDSTELNKIAGGVIGALLVFLLLSFASGKIYGTRDSGHDGEEVLAFAVEIEDAAAAADGDEKEELTIEIAIASADPDAGKKAFNQCKACHQLVDGKNGVGPHLWGILGRDIASVDGFSYSGVLADKEGNWDIAKLSAFIEKPSGWAPGTAMSFGGMRNVQMRANLIAYMNEASGSPIDLGSAAPTETSATEDGQQPSAESEGGGERIAATEPVGIDFSGGDAAAGKKVFRQCVACHKVEDGKNGVGPHLHGVIGRMIAGVDGYAYSGALSGMQGVWTGEILAAFLESPRKWAPGNKMGFAGLRKEKDRIDVIVYLNEADGSPDPLN